jgi:cyclase
VDRIRTVNQTPKSPKGDLSAKNIIQHQIKLSAKNPYKRGGMFEGANPLVFELAKDLRHNMTEAEKVLWMHLRAGVHGLKIRRQHPIGVYIADFYCHKVRLIIEVDGLIHDNPEMKDYDQKREQDLNSLGYSILRFANKEIFNDIENVLKMIKTKVEVLIQNNIVNQNRSPL